jgi:hypothetical protein
MVRINFAKYVNLKYNIIQMNLISIITQFDPEYNYYNLGMQSWSQIELVFGVEKEYIDLFLSKSINFDIPYKYIINTKNDYNQLLNIADSYYILFFNQGEVWGSDYLRNIKQYFMDRQDLGKSLKSADQINIDPLAVNRNVFYFLGKINLDGKASPVMSVFEELHNHFGLCKIMVKPTFFQPGVKFLLPLNFIKDNNIIYQNKTDNNNFNIALYYLDVLCYLYKSNNYFEPSYYSCYLDFTVNTDTISLSKYKEIYHEELQLKRDIFISDRNSDICKAFQKLKL